jgi:hypothetical protein
MKPLPVTLIVGVIVIWIASAIALIFFIPSWETRAQFGEMFGVANALFSGLAFVAIYAALTAQHQETSNEQKRFARQTELAALTAYGQITQALWLNNLQTHRETGESRWKGFADTRYLELMEVRNAFDRILKEREVLASEAANSTSSRQPC